MNTNQGQDWDEGYFVIPTTGLWRFSVSFGNVIFPASEKQEEAYLSMWIDDKVKARAQIKTEKDHIGEWHTMGIDTIQFATVGQRVRVVFWGTLKEGYLSGTGTINRWTGHYLGSPTPTTHAAGSGDPIPIVQLQEELQELKDKVTKMETDGSTTATAFDCHLSQVGEKWIGTGATVVFNKCDGRQKFNTLSR